MEIFLLILALPIIAALLARYYLRDTITWKETAVQVGLSVVVVAVIGFTGQYSKMLDTEIWNGAVTNKQRIHGHYVDSYDCNCSSSCSGSGSSQSCTTTCDTCYEDRYTVDWHLNTTIGNIQLQYLDRSSRSVYNTPDPKQYVDAYIGEPCSIEKNYQNYIKAVPESLFNNKQYGITQFATMIPAYPRVHSFYKVNRILTAGLQLPNYSEWNDYLSEKIKVIGPAKEANVLLVVVNTPDRLYRYALENAWVGGKKNDIIVIVGAPEYPKIAWVDTITLGHNAGNSLMTEVMHDDLMKIGTMENHVPVIDTISNTVLAKFDRKPMDDYGHLEDEIEPPTWAVVLGFLFAIFGSAGLTYWFHKEDVA